MDRVIYDNEFKTKKMKFILRIKYNSKEIHVKFQHIYLYVFPQSGLMGASASWPMAAVQLVLGVMRDILNLCTSTPHIHNS